MKSGKKKLCYLKDPYCKCTVYSYLVALSELFIRMFYYYNCRNYLQLLE